MHALDTFHNLDGTYCSRFNCEDKGHIPLAIIILCPIDLRKHRLSTCPLGMIVQGKVMNDALSDKPPCFIFPQDIHFMRYAHLIILW